MENNKSSMGLKVALGIALVLFFCLLDKKIKKELIKGKNIKVDKIGKFILIKN